MMIRIHWKLTMMLIPGVFTVFAFHEKQGQGVTFSLSHFPPFRGDIFPVS